MLIFGQREIDLLNCYGLRAFVIVIYEEVGLLQQNSVCERDELCANHWTVRILSNYAKARQ